MKKNQNLLLLIILLTIVLRLPAFLYGYVNIDETDYTLAAQSILNGGIPYRDFLIYQPPVIYYVYALGFLLSGGVNLWAVHILTILFVVGTVIALYKLIKSLTGSEKGALAAALFYAVYSTTFIPQDMLAANCEVLMMFPLTLAVYFLHRGIKSSTWHQYFLSGLMIGLGVLTKYQGGIVLLAALTYLFISWFMSQTVHSSTSSERTVENKSFILELSKDVILPSALITLGFILSLLLFTFYLFFSGALPEAYEAFEYIVLYAGGPAQSDRLYVFLKFAVRSIIFALPTLPIWIGSFYIIFRYARRKFSDPDLPAFTLFIIIWFFLSIIPIIMGGRIYFHYYYIILPSACALAGLWWHIKSPVMKKRTKGLVAAWLIICMVGWSSYAVYNGLKGHGKKETWIETAEYLKEIKEPNDTLFVWGLCYQLYFYSGMKLATKFTSADYLTGRFPMTAGLEFDPNMPNPPSSFEKLWNDFADKYYEVVYFDTSHNVFPPAWKYLKEEFSKKLPTYIVDTSPSNYRRYSRYPIKNYPYLQNILSENYEKVKEINGYIVYKLK